MSLKAAGKIRPDARQEATMAKLDTLFGRVKHYTPPMGATMTAAKPAKKPAASSGGGGGFFGGFFGGGKAKEPAAPKAASPPKPKLLGPRGLYVWGGTGTGKTFMMDIFADSVPIAKKKRIHFHEWMIDVHERLHRLQKGSSKAKGSADDLVAQVAGEMIDEAWLLCFDEFQVTHISDAIILKRIFEVLFARGCVVVATSNRPPEDLYLNGLNRPLFLPFIPMLKEFCEVYEIGAEVDYRLISKKEEDLDDRVYFTPNGPGEREALNKIFTRLCNNKIVEGLSLEAQGRLIPVPRSSKKSGIAWFDFADLCDKPLGAADYLAVGHAFHTIFITNIPRLTLQERDQVRRFITLIDALYEAKTKLLCVAELDPIPLFYVSEEERSTSQHDEIFAWDRTVSRLTEMQSALYLTTQARSLSAGDFFGQYSLTNVSEQALKAMWKRYDLDGNGVLDYDEARELLRDVQYITQGHGDLSDEVFNIAIGVMDANGSGEVDQDEFEKFMVSFNGDITVPIADA